ncbi:hypothetical protein MM300_19050 [Evansella sp. LMS18]|uniref:hypothetical protein n=1 Tax=Evansella sp. LMS18 TaxID=2924033 RepID=UPI0020D03F4C|nr:hypothetical protein [Evansella sp. LMS18]UTR09955.1 hypothetical protein MM300_19050 [Evansella sp. LMS18]
MDFAVILTVITFLAILAASVLSVHYFLSRKGFRVFSEMRMHLVLILAVTLVFSLISYNTYVMKVEPAMVHGISSILFLLLWFFYSFYMAGLKKRNYILFLSVYWGAGAFLILLGLLTMFPFIFYPAVFIYTVPLYGGFAYFFDVLPSFTLEFASIALLYFSSLAGYGFGRLVHVNRMSH